MLKIVKELFVVENYSENIEFSITDCPQRGEELNEDFRPEPKKVGREGMLANTEAPLKGPVNMRVYVSVLAKLGNMERSS